ncbi:MAG: hypothetical protein IVW53_14460 [Chloroflexi bacterium]|nr:hypothetical protein [Chloroflexota bacterium]
MTTGAAIADPAARSTDLRLASLHLRVGAFQLARAELEAMAGAGVLDDDALLDLAEARWRTGDLSGAGEAAAAHLGSGRDTALGLVIAAEAQSALGRPGEARRLATRALDREELDLDAIFAGLPRSALWPPDPLDPVRLAGVEAPRVASSSVATGGAIVIPSMPDGTAELEAAQADLARDDWPAAAVRLALVLRIAPVLAPAVLDVVRPLAGGSFEIIRGDAYRLVGREIEAALAYRAAADELERPSRSASVPSRNHGSETS